MKSMDAQNAVLLRLQKGKSLLQTSKDLLNFANECTIQN